MQLVLSPPDGLKNWILFANELAGDENYVAHEPSYFRCPDSERWEVDRIIREEAEAAGIKSHIFNQCQWQGTTGWEFWTANTAAILAVATRVAERLGVPCDTSAMTG